MRLENFVQENRQAFDDKIPPSMLWQGIENRLNELQPQQQIISSTPKNKVISLRQHIYHYTKVAAIGLLLLVAGGFIGSYWTGQQQQNNATLGAIGEEYEELEDFYTQKVNAQMTELKKYKYDKSIVEDIEELDNAFEELKNELNVNGSDTDNELVINEMIDNYQAKIEILERVLSHLEKNKNQTEKNKGNGKVSL